VTQETRLSIWSASCRKPWNLA